MRYFYLFFLTLLLSLSLACHHIAPPGPVIKPNMISTTLVETQTTVREKASLIEKKSVEALTLTNDLQRESKYESAKWEDLKLDIGDMGTAATVIKTTNENITFVIGAGKEYVDGLNTRIGELTKTNEHQAKQIKKLEEDLNSASMGLLKVVGTLFLLGGIVGAVFLSDMRGRFLLIAACGLILNGVAYFIQLNPWVLLAIGALSIIGVFVYLGIDLYINRKSLLRETDKHLTTKTALTEVVAGVQKVRETLPADLKTDVKKILDTQSSNTKQIVTDIKGTL